MRPRWWIGLALIPLAGCVESFVMPREPATQQVAASPFHEPARRLPPRVNVPPASQEAAFRVELLRGKLIGENPQSGLRPVVTTLGVADTEIFHVGLNNVYITEGLVRQCATDGQLAGVLAHEFGRMVAEREATVSDEVRQPERLLPIQVPVGGASNVRGSDPISQVELARFEQQHPKHAKKLPRPDPQQVARTILEKAGFQRTDLDAALPILQAAERFSVHENQFKGIGKQSDWKAP
jgi:predicted Zn-dependent protease